MWIQEYTCGCSTEAKTKKELLGYCSTHGNEERATYKARDAMEILTEKIRKQTGRNGNSF